MSRHNRAVISLFSGAMGLDLGLERAGFEIKVAVECDKQAIETIKLNRPDLPVIDQRIENVSTDEILEKAGLEKGEPCVVVGGPCCQAFSTAGKRGSLSDPLRGSLFSHFIRVVKETSPRFFVIENVKGLFSAAVKHRPLNKRGPGFPKLKPEEELGSAFIQIVKELNKLPYYTEFDLLNAADYGVPQRRERVILLGSRDGELVSMPEKTHNEDGADGLERWVSLREAIEGVNANGEHRPISDKKKKYLRHVPTGGCWRDLPKRMHKGALGSAYESWGGRTGFYRRLSWDKPAPSLTTSPDSSATMLGHPTRLRTLTVEEYARIQQFPDDWTFSGGTTQKYKQIGNAVPVGLGEAIGIVIRSTMRKKQRVIRTGVSCSNKELLVRLAARPVTMLNPPNMRGDEEEGDALKWHNGNKRDDILDVVSFPIDIKAMRDFSHGITKKLSKEYGSPRHNNPRNPLDDLIFIMLSQMTTGPSYERVFSRFKRSVGSWAECAKMRVTSIRKMIKDAGLSNQKAPRIKSVLKRIKEDFGVVSLRYLNDYSDDEVEEYLVSLPGVGVKTAKCVMMYTMNREVLPVDTHTRRVAVRLGMVPESLHKSKIDKHIEQMIRPADRYAFHVNALEHGRRVCKAIRPDCSNCVISASCISSNINDKRSVKYA